MVDGESKDRQKNMLTTIFPFITIYRVLLNDEMNKEDAMNICLRLVKSIQQMECVKYMRWLVSFRSFFFV